MIPKKPTSQNTQNQTETNQILSARPIDLPPGVKYERVNVFKPSPIGLNTESSVVDYDLHQVAA